MDQGELERSNRHDDNHHDSRRRDNPLVARDMNDRDIFKCHCNYHLGMGPNLLCPVHGKREDLFRKEVSRRYEINRLRKLLTDVSEVTDSRVIKSMIKLGLE